jgi:hypothetical protein
MREKKKMKINVFIFFTLIILIISEPCDKTGITKAECTGNTTCAWTPTKVCSGADACKEKTKESECTAESTGCTYATGTPATCKVSETPCVNGFTDKDTCEKCQWVDDATKGTCAVKPAEIANCATVDTSDSTKCKTCKDGYTLSSDSKKCEKSTSDPNSDPNSNTNSNSSFVLKVTSIIGLLLFLF